MFACQVRVEEPFLANAFKLSTDANFIITLAKIELLVTVQNMNLLHQFICDIFVFLVILPELKYFDIDP